MTPEMCEKAQEIIEKIAKLPCATPFLEEVSPYFESTRLYYKKIKDPVDLSLIKMRILLKKYQFVSEFQSDVYLILKNSRTFNGPTHYITLLAEILIKKFEKLFYAAFPMSLRIWTEKVNHLSWKMQNLFVSSKMPKFIETEAIIGATITQAIEQQDASFRQSLISGKFQKPPIFKNVKSSNNILDISENRHGSIDNNDNHFYQNNFHFDNSNNNFNASMANKNIKPALNNSFVIPVIQPASTSILKTPKVSPEKEISRPPYIPLPLEPVFIPLPSNGSTDTFINQNRNNSELIEFYQNHLSDYGFKENVTDNKFENHHNRKYSHNNRQYLPQEEEDSSDDFFLQMELLPMDYFTLENDSSPELNYHKNHNGPILQQDNLKSDNIFMEQFDLENDKPIRSSVPKSQVKGTARKSSTHKSDETDDDWKYPENKRRGRPKKAKEKEDKNQEKDKSTEKEKTIEKDKTKTKEKSKDKSKEKIKEKTKTKSKIKNKDKNENDGKPKKSSKRVPKETKEKKEIKEIKESKGHKIPRKTSLVRKTKSESDFVGNNDTMPPPKTTKAASRHVTKASEDHIEHDRSQSSEKLTIKKKKATTKRQNRRNLSADEGTDDDFVPINKLSTSSQNPPNHKRKTKNTSKRHGKINFDDDEYGIDNDDFDNDFEPNSMEETLTDGNLIAFMEAAHQLNHPNDQKEMAAIIHMTEPQISFVGAYPVIDITKLKTVTLLALIKYTKKKFKERGKDYPIC